MSPIAYYAPVCEARVRPDYEDVAERAGASRPALK
jgi:hypothetical protein